MSETTALWWHLMDDHGLDAGKTHGDPYLMHEAIHMHIKGDHDHADYHDAEVSA